MTTPISGFTSGEKQNIWCELTNIRNLQSDVRLTQYSWPIARIEEDNKTTSFEEHKLHSSGVPDIPCEKEESSYQCWIS